MLRYFALLTSLQVEAKYIFGMSDDEAREYAHRAAAPEHKKMIRWLNGWRPWGWHSNRKRNGQ